MVPATETVMVLGPGVLFAAMIASRNEMPPSAPGFTTSCAIELVSPSTTSSRVLTAAVSRFGSTTVSSAAADALSPQIFPAIQR